MVIRDILNVLSSTTPRPPTSFALHTCPHGIKTYSMDDVSTLFQRNLFLIRSIFSLTQLDKMKKNINIMVVKKVPHWASPPFLSTTIIFLSNLPAFSRNNQEGRIRPTLRAFLFHRYFQVCNREFFLLTMKPFPEYLHQHISWSQTN